MSILSKDSLFSILKAFMGLGLLTVVQYFTFLKFLKRYNNKKLKRLQDIEYRFLGEDTYLLDNLNMANFQKILKKYSEAFNTMDMFEKALPRNFEHSESFQKISPQLFQ